MLININVCKNSARAVLIFSAAIIVSSCTQSNYGALKPVPTIAQIQEAKIAEHKARVEAQQKAYKDAVLKSSGSKNTGAKIAAPANQAVKTPAAATKQTSKMVNTGKIASLKNSTTKPVQKAAPKKVKTGSRIKLNANWKCVPGKLKTVIVQASKKFGPVVVNSTNRSRRKNRRIGGAKHSWHIGCRAVDFRVKGNTRGLYSWLRRHPNVGGLKRYRSGFYHIDIGPRRSW